MRLVASLFSVQNFVISLASLSALVTVSAIPVRSDAITLARRNSVTVGGKVAKLGEQLSHANHDKSTVHQLTSWDGKAEPHAVIKTYSNGSKVKDEEIKGLQAAGQYIHHDSKHVVMKEVKGKPLADLVAKVPKDQREEFVHKWKPIVAEHAAHIAKTKGILHGDLNLNNVIVHPEGHVQLVDWEHYHKKGSPEFTTNKGDIISKKLHLWDSTQTPPQGKKSSSHKSESPKHRS